MRVAKTGESEGGPIVKKNDFTQNVSGGRLKFGLGKGVEGGSTIFTIFFKILTKQKMWMRWWDGGQQNVIPNLGRS